MLPRISKVKWNKTYRLINSCYPTYDIWEDIISQDDWDIAFELEAMSNPRIRQEIGDISLIPKDRIITGQNSWWVIASFTHVNPNGTRFTDGTYGAYYAANTFITALKEKAFGLTTQFMSATEEEIIDIELRTLVGSINSNLHDIRSTKEWSHCMDPNSYIHSQKLGIGLRSEGSNGIVYNSVRDQGGECFAAFWPDVVNVPIQERHVKLHWNGERISSYCEIKSSGVSDRIIL